MTASTCTWLSLFFIVVGLVCIVSVFYLQGRKAPNRRVCVAVHRWSGWLYITLFFAICIDMIWRTATTYEPLTGPTVMHVGLAMMLPVPMVIKGLIPRVFPRLSSHLFVLGISIYALSFAMVGVTGGYYLFRMFQPDVAISASNLDTRIADPNIGRNLFVNKCSGCHPLKEISRPRPAREWESVMSRMVDLAAPRISIDQAEQILHFLARDYVPKAVASDDLLEKHCLICHQPAELVGTGHSRQEWASIVDRMQRLSPENVPVDRLPEIVDRILQNQGAQALTNGAGVRN